MKSSVFVLAFLASVNFASAQIASDFGLSDMDANSDKVTKKTPALVTEVNREIEFQKINTSATRKSVETLIFSGLVQQKNLEEILNEIYSDPTLGRYIQNKEDLWRILGLSGKDLEEIHEVLSERIAK